MDAEDLIVGEAAADAPHVDVLIVGAGLSGVGAAYHLQSLCPNRSFLILEARAAIGGTWELFRYPGIRSDSDMYTLGYAFEPWTGENAIADGNSILRYIRGVAAKHDIDRHIRFHHRVESVAWSSADARWTVEVRRSDNGERVRFTCNWLHMCSGYYDYDAGYMPDYPDVERFGGTLIHPQFWPEELDLAGKKAVVIGSGATAVTIVPTLAAEAAHVTMLQRSPTYIVSLPARDRIAHALRRWFGPTRAYGLVRWKNVLLQMLLFRLARKRPNYFKRKILDGVRRELGPGYDIATHFTPRYNPWDQRLCLVPDGDLFAAIRSGKAAVRTGSIERFTETGVKLTDGSLIEADVVVSATGLKVLLLGGIKLEVDGEAQDLSRSLLYKGMMFSDIPNLSISFGYTNASWTLKADLIATYLCRILNRMADKGCTTAVPHRDERVEEAPFIDFTSGYIQRALSILPKQGSRAPWKLHQNYALDMTLLRLGRVEDGVLTLSSSVAPSPSRNDQLNRMDRTGAST